LEYHRGGGDGNQLKARRNGDVDGEGGEGLFFYDDLGGEKTNGEATRVFQVMVRRAYEG